MVCVVDDDASVRKSIRRLLLASNLSVETFESPALFLSYAESHPVGLAILDVRMPGGMSGLELQTRMREQLPEIPVIIITSDSELNTRETALANRAHNFLLKPFDGSELVASCKEALAMSGHANSGVDYP